MKGHVAKLLRQWAAHLGASEAEVKRMYQRLPAREKKRARVAIARELAR